MDKLRLRVLVLEFLALAVESILIEDYEDDDEAYYLDVPQMLAMWMKLPDCQLSSMFIGYALALGEDINTFSPEDLALAVQTALVGDDENVNFDWLGDVDATQKPH